MARNVDAHRSTILEIMKSTYGHTDAKRRLQRWRIFFMACAELFGYHNGGEWLVTHYRLVSCLLLIPFDKYLSTAQVCNRADKTIFIAFGDFKLK